MTPIQKTPTANPAEEQHRQAEQEIIVELLRSHEEGEEQLARAELERQLAHVDPLTLNDALARLQQRDAIQVDGEQVTATNAGERRAKLDLLAGVVRYTLVSANPDTLTVEDVARDCERDPDVYEEREEIELALRRLVIDGLAIRRDDGRWAATRPAVRADELSF
jgi:hypothetical protein